MLFPKSKMVIALMFILLIAGKKEEVSSRQPKESRQYLTFLLSFRTFTSKFDGQQSKQRATMKEEPPFSRIFCLAVRWEDKVPAGI